VTQWFLGLPDQALQRAQQAVALAEDLSIPYSRVFALSFAAWIHVRRREADAALAHLAALKALASEHGFAFFLAEGSILEGCDFDNAAWPRFDIQFWPHPDVF